MKRRIVKKSIPTAVAMNIALRCIIILVSVSEIICEQFTTVINKRKQNNVVIIIIVSIDYYEYR